MLKKSERRPMKYILIATALLASCGSLPGKTLVEKHLLMSVEDFEGYMGLKLTLTSLCDVLSFFNYIKKKSIEIKMSVWLRCVYLKRIKLSSMKM